MPRSCDQGIDLLLVRRTHVCEVLWGNVKVGMGLESDALGRKNHFHGGIRRKLRHLPLWLDEYMDGEMGEIWSLLGQGRSTCVDRRNVRFWGHCSLLELVLTRLDKQVLGCWSTGYATRKSYNQKLVGDSSCSSFESRFH